MKQITILTNSKENNSNVSKHRYSSFSLAYYEKQMINSAIRFLAHNNVYIDDETFANIKKLVMDDLDKRNASQKDKDEVSASFDRDIDYYKYEVKGNTRKVMIQELDDLFYFCISIVRDISMDGKKSTSKKSIDDYYKSFLDDIDRYKKWLHNFEEVDVMYLMFEVICGCKIDGGDFHMIDALQNKLGEYLEANFKD